MADRNITFKLKPFIQGNKIADAVDIETTAAGDVQGTLDALQRDLVASNRELNVFNDGVTITSANISQWQGKNNIYGAARDKDETVLLPRESQISLYPAIFEFQHFGGTARLTTTNRLFIDSQDGDGAGSEIRRDSETGNLLTRVALFRADTVVFTKEAAGSPWVAIEGATDPRSSVLPSGLFSLNERVLSLVLFGGGPNYALAGLSSYNPNQGDAFLIGGVNSIDETSTFGGQINVGDVIVAKVNNPSVTLDGTNDDWLIIRDARHLPLTAQEFRFLSQVTESDRTFDAGFLKDQSTVNDALVWLSPAPLETAPFLVPSADTDNPRTPETEAYVGGRENRNTDLQFTLSSDRTAWIPYVGITPAFFSGNTASDVSFIIKDVDGDELRRFNLEDDFELLDDATFTNPTVRHYVLNTTGTAGSETTINYIAGQTLELHYSETRRRFTFDSETVNATQNVSNLDKSQLNEEAQSLLEAQHGLTDQEEQKLAGLETTLNVVPLPSSYEILWKNGDATNSESDYFTTTVGTGLVPDFVDVKRTVLVDKNVVNLSITRTTGFRAVGEFIGKIAYTFTQQASTDATGNPLNDISEISGNLNNYELSGANPSFKIDIDNLSTDLRADKDSYEAKVDNLFPLTPDVTKLTSWADGIEPVQDSQIVEIRTGYSEIADYRAAGDRYESAGVTYGTGTNVITYSGLTEGSNRAFGFKVAAPADKTLMWYDTGTEKIPYVRITAAGNIQINNYSPSHEASQDVTDRPVFLTRTGASILPADGTTVSTYQIPDFPAGVTNASRRITAVPQIYFNGSDTGSGGAIDLDIPQTNVDQAKRTTTHTFTVNVGGSIRSVDLTFGYAYRVSGSDYFVDFTLETAPTGYTAQMRGVTLFQSFTTTTTVSREDNWESFAGASGAYTFTGGQEFLITFRPYTGNPVQNVPGVTVTDAGVFTQFNDVHSPSEVNSYGSIEVADDIEFRTFFSDHYYTHNNLQTFLQDRGVKWAYGIARLIEQTEWKINQELDFDSFILISPDDSRWRVTVDNSGTLITTSI